MPSGTSASFALLSGNLIAGADPALSGVRAGSVTAAGYSLPGEYATLSNLFGGGSVGLAPFPLHDEDCFPVNGGTYLLPPTAGQVVEYPIWQWTNGHSAASSYPSKYRLLPQVRSRFYGPVRRTGPISQGTADQGVVIQWYNGSTWADVTSKFNVVWPETFATPARDVLTEFKCATTFDRGLYRVIGTFDAASSPATALVCSYVTGAPNVQRFAHYFKLSPAFNPADLGTTGGTPGGDGVLDNDDFVVFTDYFFAHNPKADLGVQGGIAGEDGIFDNNDFVMFNDWFLGAYDTNTTGACPLAPSPIIRGGEGEGGEAMMQSTDDSFLREYNALWSVYSSLPSDNPHRQDVLDRITALLNNR